MEINCLGCGYKVELAEAYDDFEGPIKCFACGATMEIAAHKGCIRTVKSVMAAPPSSAEKPSEGIADAGENENLRTSACQK
jgi:hypothetical protein